MIREIAPGDVAAVVGLVRELAEYERELSSCLLTTDQLTEALFGPSPALFGHVAVIDGEVVGCALWFLNFSTWRGTPGIYLEDLYVQPAHRGRGLGRGLLATLAAVCVERGFARLEWSVLDWNTPSIEFYRSIGAVPMDGWTTFRLDGDALTGASREGRRWEGPRPEGRAPSTTPGTAR